jgi:hypothetical protein
VSGSSANRNWTNSWGNQNPQVANAADFQSQRSDVATTLRSGLIIGLSDEDLAKTSKEMWYKDNLTMGKHPDLPLEFTRINRDTEKATDLRVAVANIQMTEMTHSNSHGDAVLPPTNMCFCVCVDRTRDWCYLVYIYHAYGSLYMSDSSWYTTPHP